MRSPSSIGPASRRWAFFRLLILLSLAVAVAPACNDSRRKRRRPGGGSGIVVQFISPTFSVVENAGAVMIEVRRQGGSTEAAQVDFATSDGTAQAGVDYLATSGTLAWGPGDVADKTFPVTVLDDGCGGVDVEFVVALSNPSAGVGLGVNDSATVTIIDDDTSLGGISDPAFGVGGVITADPSARYDAFTPVAIDGGFIYVVAFDESPGTIDWQIRLEKRSLADGAPDPAFGSGGVALSDPTPAGDIPWDLAVDGGFLFIVGYDEGPNPGGGDWQWRIEKRSTADGGLDPAFGTGGVVTNNPSAGTDEAQALAVDGGSIYVGGYDLTQGLPDWQWRLEKRSAVDGAPDPAFGTAGVVVSDRPGTAESIYDLAVDGTHVYAFGWDSEVTAADRQWRLEKRSKLDGVPDAAFGTGGAVQINPGSGFDFGSQIAIDATHAYLAGSDTASGSADLAWRVEKRSLVDGAPDPVFGTGGVVRSDPSVDRDELRGLRLDGTALFLAGGSQELGNARDQWRVEKRSAVDGSLDPCFGTGGVVLRDPSPDVDYAWDLAVEATSIVIVGEEQTPGPDNRAIRMEKLLR